MRKLFLLLIFILVHSLSISQESVQLRWNPSTDNVGVAGYNIWLNAEYYGTTSDTFFIFQDLPIGTHLLAVSAFDAAGNESDKSETLMITIRDGTPPTVPFDLMLAYPNPTYGGFTVLFGQEIKPNTIFQILTPNGQLVYHKRLPINSAYYKERFELENLLQQGIYVLALIENGIRKGHIYLTVVGQNRENKTYASVRGTTTSERTFVWAPFSNDLMVVRIP